MFKYDFGELGVRPMRVNHKLSPSQGWDGEPCLFVTCLLHFTNRVPMFCHPTVEKFDVSPKSIGKSSAAI